MCKYCDDYIERREDIIYEGFRISGMRTMKYRHVYISDGKLKVGLKNYHGIYFPIVSFDIQYCPICGRNLIDED